MKVQWWQDGIHVSPENDEERKALAALYQVLHLTDFVDELPAAPVSSVDGNDKDSVV